MCWVAEVGRVEYAHTSCMKHVYDVSMDRKAITESRTYIECALGKSSGRSGPSESSAASSACCRFRLVILEILDALYMAAGAKAGQPACELDWRTEGIRER